ncbi:MAG: CCC motif membrane protein [Flavobacteriaceae bacterium]
MNQSKLPADPLSIILGITALVVIVGGCCCYGLTVFAALALSIVGLVAANRSLSEYKANPEAYSRNSRGNVLTGRVLNIIAVVLSGIYILILTGFFLVYGSLISSGMFNNFDLNNPDWYPQEEEPTDYEYDYDEEQIIEEDSLYEKDDDSLYYYEQAIYIEERI